MLRIESKNSDIDIYISEIENSLEKYEKLSLSHAVTQNSKSRVFSCISKIKSLLVIYKAQGTPVIRGRINEIMDDLSLMEPLSSRDGMTPLQNREDIRVRQEFIQLIYCDKKHYILKRNGDMNIADGEYCFIVPVSAPWEVWMSTRAKGGHTSVSRGCDVYFAGELFVSNGNLVFWNNNSGHYRTPANLSRQVPNILPFSKYRPMS
ncbi:MAG: hypothetical protein H6R25_2089 [Proteobacteria bacterium]|nr:hypothetical protein [Pseudomonadota bacterium]